MAKYDPISKATVPNEKGMRTTAVILCKIRDEKNQPTSL